MLLTKLYGENFLSFGEKGPDLTLAPLNVLIGVNGSGKSNFVELISVLHSFISDITLPIQRAGGFSGLISNKKKGIEFFSIILELSGEEGDWFYQANVENQGDTRVCFEKIRFTSNKETGSRDVDRIKNSITYNNSGSIKTANLPDSFSTKSVLSIFDLNYDYEELYNAIKGIRIYRDREMGRFIPARWPQPADAKNDFLDEKALNLGLVLSNIRQHPKEKRKLLDYLKRIYEDITDFNVLVQGNTVQIFLEEGDVSIPATRLSDGTIHYLCLLAILCHPKPPALICIEEPEVGLHPDMMRTIAELLVDASQRTQLIVTTHSDALIDALSDHPEYVVVCEKQDGVTQMRRLEPDKLKVWLEKYSLGQLWTRGDIGGTRW